MTIHEPIQALIWQCLNHYDYENATFLSERLHSEVANEDSLFNMSTCYYRTGQIEAVKYILSKELKLTSRLKFLLAKCYYETQDYYKAEILLVGRSHMDSKKKDFSLIFGEAAPFVLQLLSKIYIKLEREDKAIEMLNIVIRNNPCLWISFKNLCDMKCQINPDEIYKKCDIPKIIKNLNESSGDTMLKPVTLFDQTNQITANDMLASVEPVDAPCDTLHSPADPCASALKLLTSSCSDRTPKYSRRQMRSRTTLMFGQYVTVPPMDPAGKDSGSAREYAKSCAASLPPSSASASANNTTSAANASTLQPCNDCNRCKSCTGESPESNKTSSRTCCKSLCPASLNMPALNIDGNQPSFGVMQRPQVVVQTSRKNSSTTQLSNNVKENKKKRVYPARISQNYLPKKKMKVANTQSDLIYNMQMKSLGGLLTLLSNISHAYVSVTNYQCDEAIKKLTSLPEIHTNSAFVQMLIGKVLFDSMMYAEAKLTYQRLLCSTPYYISCCDYYSTTLWHLNADTELSTLSERCVKSNRRDPQTWVAMGNCFSLQKRHQLAIQYFKRAVMLDKYYPYAYSLMAHEYIYIQDFDNAQQSFRAALAINKRHYPSWTGLGLIHYKQEKLKMAETYFRNSFNLNPTSCVVLCHLGIVENSLGNRIQAIETLNKALLIQPKNELCRYNRAHIYYCMDKCKESLEDLNHLKSLAPKEAAIYILMGKVHKKLGDNQKAMVYFSWAQDIDPKGNLNDIEKNSMDHFEIHEDMH